MGTGILVCGLNGAGKTTLGGALARRLGVRFIDIEDLYFPKTDPSYPYAVQRARREVEKLLLHELRAPGGFVLAAVTGGYGEAVYPFFRLAVLLEAPGDVRLERVRNRSFQKFGSRMLPGGDLYEREKGFFDLVSSRSVDSVENWLRNLTCPVIRLDGTRPVGENVELIAGYVSAP